MGTGHRRGAHATLAATFHAHADLPPVNDTPSASEAELLGRLRRGDDAAFAAIFRAHYAALVRNATHLLRERSLAEEIAQEVMLELWRRRDGLLITGSLATYLHQATRNRALNRLRHDRTVQRSVAYVRPPSSAPDADDRALTSELRSAIEAAVGALSGPQREVFDLSRTNGLTYAEIAELLGISVKTVEARMGRALKELRERLGEWLAV
jgi:RNA polymerase sigma-70 factor (ECF subfamily)